MTRPTRIGRTFPLTSASSIGDGGTISTGGSDDTFPGSGTVPTATGSNTWAWGSNVSRITSNTSNALTGPFVNFASGSGISFAAASNTLTISATGGAGVSDHGDLDGLADDDHPQYVRATDGGGEVISTVAASGTTETLDLANGNVHDVTLTDDCTFTFSGATAGRARSFTLLLRQGTGFPHTVTWPGSVVWADGSAPTLATGSGEVDVLTFFTLDGGTVWFGFATGGGGGTPATTVESETTFGITPAVGTDTEYARQDHTHGTPTAATVAAVGRWVPVMDGSGNVVTDGGTGAALMSFIT